MKRVDSQFGLLRLAASLLALLALFPIGQPALARSEDTAGDSAYTSLKSAPSGALEVKSSEDECRFLSYRIEVPYPSNALFEKIAVQLKLEHWKQLHLDMFNKSNVAIPEKWKHWTNVTGGRVHTEEEQWQSPEGAVLYYKFWYFSPDLKTLKVEARYCSKEHLKRTSHRVACKNVPPARGDDPAFSAAVSIIKIERQKDGFKVHFRIDNKGSKPFLLPTDGKRGDGSPHLRVYPEQQEDGEWSGVGNECLEYTPQVWIDVKPSASVEGWVNAVDFPEANKRFGMCTRRIGHLHGRIRISFRYFTGTCDIQNIFAAKKPYFGTSEPVEPPNL